MSATRTATALTRHQELRPPTNSRTQRHSGSGRTLASLTPVSQGRETSPSKTVHFPPSRELIVGPTSTRSPSRAAMESDMAGEGEDVMMEDEDTPTKQLEKEIRHAEHMVKVREHQRRVRLIELDLGIDLQPGQRRPAQVRGVYPPWVKMIKPGDTPPPRDFNKPILSPVIDQEILKPYAHLDVDGNLSDEELCRRMHDLQTQIVAVPTKFFEVKPDMRDLGFAYLLDKENKTLVDYISFIADGGADDIEGWKRLLTETKSRNAVVIGVIAKVLKHTIFDRLYFGADEELAERLRRHEAANLNKDGFVRARERAQIINESERRKPSAGSVEFADAFGLACLSLCHFLMPLYGLSGHDRMHYRTHYIDERVHAIAAEAVALSRAMRRQEDAVYHWLPTSKDEEFAFHSMDCLNLDEMVRTSPFETAAATPDARRLTQAIVRVVCFQGLVVYRPGGGETAQRELSAGLNPSMDRGPGAAARGGGPTELDGFRSRILIKSLVLLEWGQQRRLTREAGTSAHLDTLDAGEERAYKRDYAGRRSLYSYWLVENDPHPRLEGPTPHISMVEMAQRARISPETLERRARMKAMVEPGGILYKPPR